MIGKIAENLGNHLYNNAENKQLSLDKTIYTIHIILNITFVFLTALSISFVLGNPSDFTLSFSGFMILRLFSGSGWHFKNDLYCYIFSTLLFTAIPNIPVNHNFYIFFSISSILIVSCCAPLSKRIELKTKRWLFFKLVSLSIILLNILFFQSFLLSLAFFIQLLSIIKFKRGVVKDVE